MRRILKSLAPEWLMNRYYQLRGRTIRFVGTYPNWRAAQKNAIGYDANEILRQVMEKTHLVVLGEVAYERDGVVFDEPAYSYPLIALLLRAASENNSRLIVLDFGGSLGSTYYQCRSFFGGVSSLKWCVVEQSHFVEAGNSHFADKVLSFYNSIAESSGKYQPNVVLFSGVLQYLPEPYAILEQAISRQPDYIVIDRTSFVAEGDTVLSLQKIPKTIVEGSYPVWLFNEQKIKRVFAERYTEIATFDAIDGSIGYGRLKANFKGVIFRRIMEKQGSK